MSKKIIGLIKKTSFLFLGLLLPFLARATEFTPSYEKLYNPLPDNQLFCPTAVCDLQQFVLLIMRDILQLIPVVSVLFIIIGGFQIITAAGNEERYIKAKRTILWAVLGLVVAFLSFSIISVVQNLLQGNL
jgi:hypothetical protein